MVYFSPAVTQQISNFINFTPTHQRFTLGATGIVSQPALDYSNPWVDKDTRKYSAIKTAIKIFVGTITGVLSRYGGQKMGEWLVNTGKMEVPQSILTKFKNMGPDTLRYEFAKVKNIPIEKVPRDPNLYTTFAKMRFGNAVGWVCAVLAAAVAVFALEIPFINKLLNRALKKFAPQDDQNQPPDNLKQINKTA